jgi:hypothetical protein
MVLWIMQYRAKPLHEAQERGICLPPPVGHGVRPTHFTAFTSSVLNAGWSWTRSSWPSVSPTMRAVRCVVIQTAGWGFMYRTLGDVSASTSMDAVLAGIVFGSGFT